MISLDRLVMTNKEVVEQLKKRFKQYTIGALWSYSFANGGSDFGEVIIKINKCGEECGLEFNICGQNITINQNVKDKVLDSIVGAIVWDNRDGTTRVNMHISDIYVSGNHFEYYLRTKEQKNEHR